MTGGEGLFVLACLGTLGLLVPSPDESTLIESIRDSWQAMVASNFRHSKSTKTSVVRF